MYFFLFWAVRVSVWGRGGSKGSWRSKLERRSQQASPIFLTPNREHLKTSNAKRLLSTEYLLYIFMGISICFPQLLIMIFSISLVDAFWCLSMWKNCHFWDLLMLGHPLPPSTCYNLKCSAQTHVLNASSPAIMLNFQCLGDVFGGHKKVIEVMGRHLNLVPVPSETLCFLAQLHVNTHCCLPQSPCFLLTMDRNIPEIGNQNKIFCF